MFNALFQTFFGASGIFRKTGQAEKFCCTTIDHLFVNPDLIVCQLPSALFAARLYSIVIHAVNSVFI